jgi:hypothetical protein
VPDIFRELGEERFRLNNLLLFLSHNPAPPATELEGPKKVQPSGTLILAVTMPKSNKQFQAVKGLTNSNRLKL